MKHKTLVTTLVIMGGALLTVNAGSSDDVIGAAKKLADQSSYSWKTTIDMGGGGGGGGRFRPGPTEGKVVKDGYTCLSMSRGDNTLEAFLKGDKGAIKTADGWESLAEAAQGGGGGGGGQRNPGRFLARMLRNFKAPAEQAQDVAAKVKELQKADDLYSGGLTEDGAKQLLSFGPRRNGGGPEISNAKGSAKFWVKDGLLTKYEFNVQGTVSFNGNDRDVNRTTTVEIKDVGSTKVEIPDEAAKKISS